MLRSGERGGLGTTSLYANYGLALARAIAFNAYAESAHARERGRGRRARSLGRTRGPSPTGSWLRQPRSRLHKLGVDPVPPEVTAAPTVVGTHSQPGVTAACATAVIPRTMTALMTTVKPSLRISITPFRPAPPSETSEPEHIQTAVSTPSIQCNYRSGRRPRGRRGVLCRRAVASRCARRGPCWFRIWKPDGELSPKATPTVAGGNEPNFIWVSPDGKSVYAHQLQHYGAGGISQYDVGAGGELSPKATPTVAGGNGPEGIAVVPDQGPTASFSASAAAAGSASAFDGSASSDPDGTVARYDWNFGDGTTLANGGAKPTHTYTIPGTYTVALTVTDDAGCSTTHRVHRPNRVLQRQCRRDDDSLDHGAAPDRDRAAPDHDRAAPENLRPARIAAQALDRRAQGQRQVRQADPQEQLGQALPAGDQAGRQLHTQRRRHRHVHT